MHDRLAGDEQRSFTNGGMNRARRFVSSDQRFWKKQKITRAITRDHCLWAKGALDAA